MKNLISLISALIFSTLFYKQNIGLNLFLFSVLTSSILILKNPELTKNRSILLKIAAYLITGVMVYFYNSSLVILANLIAFFTLIGSVSEPKSSIYVNWINGIYTSIVSYFSRYYDRADLDDNNEKKKKIDYLYWSKIIGIPLALSLIFIALYRNGNPVFNDMVSKIDFSFINIQWIIFTGLGYYLFYNISHPITVETLTSNDLRIGNNLKEINLNKSKIQKVKKEKQLGLVLLVVLNLLILFFLATDIFYLTEIYQMTAPQLSDQVHNGVNALIISNVLAIVIILYFFRGELNFYNENKDLKKLTAIWIFLNLMVVFSTVLKNIEYMSSFGLTYKRIGVIFFLIATSIGLITTYIKVFKIKNLWFLFRQNLSLAFAILVISTTINWDKLITHYNINYADVVDYNYLINLSNNNTFMLKAYAEKNDINLNFQKRIDQKYENYIKDLKDNSWQEVVYDNSKIEK
ncbi:DUF4153 domain-containing protein [Psychroflexus aestuariivivens]|uniref:DUF4153 domain-containing protein n=1 Tax=Psychroflexus aestuariivivens TaxID=1795040 RepID=UPI000FD84218|nr:DUF4173 domain-containing protein [Psychroflexus aestuariivivens]